MDVRDAASVRCLVSSLSARLADARDAASMQGTLSFSALLEVPATVRDAATSDFPSSSKRLVPKFC